MSKLSPLLQEVEVNEDLETNNQEELVTVDAPELEVGKNCPEGSIWDEEQGMCVLKEEVVLGDVVDDSTKEVVKTTTPPSSTTTTTGDEVVADANSLSTYVQNTFPTFKKDPRFINTLLY